MPKKKYQILSPNGITIDPKNPFYTSKKQGMKAFNKWKKGYKKQGYYSSNSGQIHLDDLADECQWNVL